MDKKIILLIIGLLLILLGLFGWNNFKKENSIDDKVIEDLNNIPVQEEVKKEDAVEETAESTENLSKEVKVDNKTVVKQTPSKSTEVKTIQQKEETKVFEESLLETKTLTDPYVDENGNIVVQNEFRPHLKDKIFFRGVVYNIKTKIAPAETKEN